MKKTIQQLAIARKQRVRAKIKGTGDRPRLSVRVTNRHIVVQLINDASSTTLGYVSTVKAGPTGNLTDKAVWAGTEIANQAKKHKIKQVVFDRGSHRYQKRLGALADAARKQGLEF